MGGIVTTEIRGGGLPLNFSLSVDFLAGKFLLKRTKLVDENGLFGKFRIKIKILSTENCEFLRLSFLT